MIFMKTLILFLAFAGVAVSQPLNGGGGEAITPGTILIKEDFNNLVPAIASANGLIGTYGWSTTVSPAGSGSIASVSNGGTDSNHAGIVKITAGAAAGDINALYLGDTSTSQYPLPDLGST